MEAMLDELRVRFDFVMLDTAPALVVADAISLAPFTDGVIVIADASKTASAAVSHMRHQLERVGARIVGGILNNLDPKDREAVPGVLPRPTTRAATATRRSPPTATAAEAGQAQERRLGGAEPSAGEDWQ